MNDPDYLTDTAFLERVLRAGPLTTSEILRLSMQERGTPFTVHSRAADLRRKLENRGETVKCVCLGRGKNGRAQYRYSIEPVMVVEDGGQLALRCAA